MTHSAQDSGKEHSLFGIADNDDQNREQSCDLPQQLPPESPENDSHSPLLLFRWKARTCRMDRKEESVKSSLRSILHSAVHVSFGVVLEKQY